MSRPFWCSTRLVTWPFSFFTNSICAYNHDSPGVWRKTMSDVCNVTYAVDFVKTNLSDAATVAQQLQVSTEFILGLSAAESGWGRDWNATKVVNGQPARNFFSLQGDASSPFANGSMKSGGGTSLSTFASYLDSAKSFAAQYGTLVKGKATAKEF